MIIKKTFRFRLKPNRKQKGCFASFAGACRWVYNFGLGTKKEAYEKEGKSVSYFDLNNLLPGLKGDEKTSWLKEIHSQLLQQSLKDLDSAFQHFFRRVKQVEKPGFPRFKRKGTGDSFRYPQGVKIDENRAYFPKIGWVRFRKSRETEGIVKQTTVIREAGKWYVCFSCELEQENRKLSLREDSVVGIDMGLATFATIATQDEIFEIANPRFLKKNLHKLRFLHKNLSRKVFKSRNWFKTKHQLQVFQATLKNCRKDFAHKLSTHLVKSHDIVGIESLSIQSLLRSSSSSLARSLSDAGWRQFLSFLKYKLQYSYKALVEADRFFASTKICSKCSCKREMELSDRFFRCPCGNEMGRDENAAINIRNMAMTKYKAAGATV